MAAPATATPFSGLIRLKRTDNPPNQATVDLRGITPMSNCACDEHRETIRLSCPEKRRQALRGRNLTRNIRVSDGPTVHQTPGSSCSQGSFLFLRWTSEACL